MGSGGEAFGWTNQATAANLRIILAIAKACSGPPVPRLERSTTSWTLERGQWLLGGRRRLRVSEGLCESMVIPT